MNFDPKNWKLYLLYDWWICIVIAVFIFFIVKYHWSRRWLYYYASKLDGPLSLPLVGNVHYFLGPYEDACRKFLKLANDSSEIFRLWVGKDLYIFNSRPEHIEIILNKCLEKSPVYEMITGNVVSDSLLVSPVNQWKKNRKLIIPTFHPTIIKSFQKIFATNSKILVDRLRDKCQKELDIFPNIWRTTLEMASETLFDVDNISSFANLNETLSQLIRWEEINTKRIIKPWLHPTLFWKLSALYKESNNLFSELRNISSKIIQTKKWQYINEEIKKLQFLNHLINNESKLTEKELFEEFQIMLVASTETTSITQSFVLLVLAILPEIQQNIFEELYTIFGDSKREATLEDLNQMDYLERVIKETMRLFPPFLVIARFLDSDVKIDKYVFPKGSTIVVPIVHVHRTSKLWMDPLKFDPDRFLPEEIKKRHRCAYIPFSVGPRNCPGIQYGMISMKTLLSTLLRNYKIVSCNYQSLEDIKMVFNLVTKPHKDFKLVLEKRV